MSRARFKKFYKKGNQMKQFEVKTEGTKTVKKTYVIKAKTEGDARAYFYEGECTSDSTDDDGEYVISVEEVE